MTPEEQARLAELEHVRDHEIGCLCDGCEEWRMITDPEYRDGRPNE